MSKKFRKDEFDDEFQKGKKKQKPRQVNAEWYPYEAPIIDIPDAESCTDSSEDSDD